MLFLQNDSFLHDSTRKTTLGIWPARNRCLMLSIVLTLLVLITDTVWAQSSNHRKNKQLIENTASRATTRSRERNERDDNTDSEKPAPILPDDQQLLKQIENLIDEIDDDLDKSRLLRSLARLQGRNGNRNASEKNFERAKKALERVKLLVGDSKTREFQVLAHEMIDVGFCEDALQIASILQQTKDDKTRMEGDSIILAVASKLVKRGHKKEALQLKKKVLTKGYDDWLIVTVALAQAEIGDFNDAMQSVKDISDESAMFAALVGRNSQQKGIAQIQAKHGDLAGALKIIEKTLAIAEKSNERFRDFHLARIAIAQAQIGDYQNAVKTVDSIQLPSFKQAALQEIAVNRAISGDWMMAAKLLSKQVRKSFLTVDFAHGSLSTEGDFHERTEPNSWATAAVAASTKANCRCSCVSSHLGHPRL